MKLPLWHLLSLLTALCVITLPALADEPVPHIKSIAYANAECILELDNLATGGTYYIERSMDLSANGWLVMHSFEGDVASLTWTDHTLGASPRAFYRVLRDPYHAKVGYVAQLTTHFHDVSGTARIVNNRTIEITDFNFDGTGIVIEVYISPNNTFTPYTSISDNLLGPPFVNETLTLDLPVGTDLDAVNYISIWCVAAGISFGDGVFVAP